MIAGPGSWIPAAAVPAAAEVPTLESKPHALHRVTPTNNIFTLRVYSAPSCTEDGSVVFIHRGAHQSATMVLRSPSETPAPNSPLALGDNVSSSPTRPTSAYTLHSTFADSAVDMDLRTPTETLDPLSKVETPSLEPTVSLSPEDVDQTLSDKMRRLAAVAWTLEQDDSMPAPKRRQLHRILGQLESQLESVSEDIEENDAFHVQSAVDQSPESTPRHAEVEEIDEDSAEDEDVWIDESDLITVRESLAATVQAMRMRHEEQHHLQQLTAQKLEALAERCLQHEQRAQELLQEIEELRHENRTLGTDNDQLRSKLGHLEEEATRNEVAVEAMSTAVTGLEGWIEHTHASPAQTPVTNRKAKRQKVVIRGKGRFRGRYYVDEDGDEAVAYSLADTAAENQELHDGIQAWLRGFRDVEEELRHHESPNISRPQDTFRSVEHREFDDWGEFETAAQSQ